LRVIVTHPKVGRVWYDTVTIPNDESVTMPYLKPYRHSKSLAFTVSELLIALGILGLIATFTVPKVLHSIDEASYRTALKEVEGVIQTVANEAYTQGYTGSRFNYYREKMNTVKVCTNPNGITQGCMVLPEGSGDISEYNENALVLPSGVTIGAINNNTFRGSGDGWRIDLNGTKPPNTEGIDILRWSPATFESNGDITSCNGRQLGCVQSHVASSNRYNQLMGLP
jgi:type II secretory pathway pseudopilin PulG